MHYIEKGENKLQVKRDHSGNQKIKLASFPYQLYKYLIDEYRYLQLHVYNTSILAFTRDSEVSNCTMLYPHFRIEAMNGSCWMCSS